MKTPQMGQAHLRTHVFSVNRVQNPEEKSRLLTGPIQFTAITVLVPDNDIVSPQLLQDCEV